MVQDSSTSQKFAFIGGSVGAVVIATAQTPVDQAASNVSSWLNLFGFRNVPVFLASDYTDSWVTVVGIAIVLGAMSAWYYRRRQEGFSKNLGDMESASLRSHPAYFEEQARQAAIDDSKRTTRDNKVQALLGAMFVSQEEIQKDQEAKAEANRRKIIAEAGRPARPSWIPLHRALRYLVYDSRWAETQSPVKNKNEFDRLVADEFLEHLARGEIQARGKRGWADKSKERRTTQAIDAGYWINAFMMPHGQIVLADDDNCAVGQLGDSGYRYVIVDEIDVKRIWPQRRSGQALTPLANFCEPLREKIALEKSET